MTASWLVESAICTLRSGRYFAVQQSNSECTTKLPREGKIFYCPPVRSADRQIYLSRRLQWSECIDFTRNQPRETINELGKRYRCFNRVCEGDSISFTNLYGSEYQLQKPTHVLLATTCISTLKTCSCTPRLDTPLNLGVSPTLKSVLICCFGSTTEKM